MKKNRWIAALSLLVLLFVTACGGVPGRKASTGTDGAETGGPAMNTVRVMAVGMDPTMDAMISAFHAKYANYRVERVALQIGGGSAISENIKDKINQGEADVIMTNFNYADLVKSNLLLDLAPFIQKNRFDLKPYGPGLDQTRWEGRLYDLPISITPQLITYNKEMFQAAGLSAPASGWTWDQFRDTAHRLTKGDGDSKVWGFATPSLQSVAQMYLEQKAGVVNWPTDEKAMKDALQFFSALVFADGSVASTARFSGGGQAGGQAAVQAFIRGGSVGDGRAAMGLDSVSGLGAMVGAAGVVVRMGGGGQGGGGSGGFQGAQAGSSTRAIATDVAPVPTVPGAKGTASVRTVSYGIASTTRNADAAFRFLSFAAGPDGAVVAARAGTVPMYNSPAVKQAWFDRQPAPSPGTEAFFTTTWSVAPRNEDALRTRFVRAAQTVLSATLSGEKPWEDAYGDYVQQIEQIREEAKK